MHNKTRGGCPSIVDLRSKHDTANIESARIILNDPEKYAGLQLDWARSFVPLQSRNGQSTRWLQPAIAHCSRRAAMTVRERRDEETFDKSGFRLVSVMEPDLLQDDPSRKLMRQIFGAIAEFEKTLIVRKLRGARVRARAKRGRCEGRKPFGYYEGEAEVIGRMKALRAQGIGFDRIAAALNTEGVKSRAGARWHGLTVNRILTGKNQGPPTFPARSLFEPQNRAGAFRRFSKSANFERSVPAVSAK